MYYFITNSLISGPAINWWKHKNSPISRNPCRTNTEASYTPQNPLRLHVICSLCCSVCNMNVHKRCEKNVANNCGINTKDMAAVLNQLGISGDKLNASKRKKVKSYSELFLCILSYLSQFISMFGAFI